MPKSYWTKIQTPNGLKYFRADDVTDELMDKIKTESSEVFVASYGDSDIDDILSAISSGKFVTCRDTNGKYYELMQFSSSNPKMVQFANVNDIVQNFNGTWSSWTGNRYARGISIAPEYSTASTYNIGDAVVHEGIRYICNTNILTAEQWTPAHWTEMNVEDALKDRPIKVFEFSGTNYPTMSEMNAEFNAGKTIVLIHSPTPAPYAEVYYLTKFERDSHTDRTTMTFIGINRKIVVNDNAWTFSDCFPQAASVAPEYDSTATYPTVGTAVMHEGIRYVSNTAINVAENWNPLHWTERSVQEDLTSIDKFAIFECTSISQLDAETILNAYDAGKIIYIKVTPNSISPTEIYESAYRNPIYNEYGEAIYFASLMHHDKFLKLYSDETDWLFVEEIKKTNTIERFLPPHDIGPSTGSLPFANGAMDYAMNFPEISTDGADMAWIITSVVPPESGILRGGSHYELKFNAFPYIWDCQAYFALAKIYDISTAGNGSIDFDIISNKLAPKSLDSVNNSLYESGQDMVRFTIAHDVEFKADEPLFVMIGIKSSESSAAVRTVLSCPAIVWGDRANPVTYLAPGYGAWSISANTVDASGLLMDNFLLKTSTASGTDFQYKLFDNYRVVFNPGGTPEMNKITASSAIGEIYLYKVQ